MPHLVGTGGMGSTKISRVAGILEAPDEGISSFVPIVQKRPTLIPAVANIQHTPIGQVSEHSVGRFYMVGTKLGISLIGQQVVVCG